jgi:hypothetical protein
MAVLSVAGLIIGLFQPPDSDGWAADSYGTREYGYRGFYEIAEELDFDAKRRLVPPVAPQKDDAVLVLIRPDQGIVSTEPGYLKEAAEWVERGGCLIIAPQPVINSTSNQCCSTSCSLAENRPALKALGLDRVSVTNVTMQSNQDTAPGELGEPLASSARDVQSRLSTAVSLPVGTDGSLAGLDAGLANVRLPANDAFFISPSSEPEPSGTVFVTVENGKRHILAANYPRGAGDIIVVSDPALFMNALIAEDDNPVLAVSLLSGRGKRVVFDEFYHGLTMRGNPAWLLAQHPYGLLAAALLFLVIMWVWREYVRLGPAVAPLKESRRGPGEYVQAMANLFYRGNCRKFLLSEVRSGAVWELRRRLHLSPGQENVPDVSRALQRRDEAAAEAFRNAAAEVDRMAENSTGQPREKDMTAAAKEITDVFRRAMH